MEIKTEQQQQVDFATDNNLQLYSWGVFYVDGETDVVWAPTEGGALRVAEARRPGVMIAQLRVRP